jgi:hypothetical protein
MRRVLHITLFLVFCWTQTLAGPATGFGKVVGRVNSQNGNPLVGATILLSSSFDFTESLVTAVSNKNGEFQVANLAPGQYAVRVTQSGYQPHLRAPVDVRPGGTTQLILILQNLVSFAPPESDSSWDFKTVLRSTRDRRMIFRDQEPLKATEEIAAFQPPKQETLFAFNDKTKQTFAKSATVEAYADGLPGSEGLFSAAAPSSAGMRSNFGYTLQ